MSDEHHILSPFAFDLIRWKTRTGSNREFKEGCIHFTWMFSFSFDWKKKTSSGERNHPFLYHIDPLLVFDRWYKFIDLSNQRRYSKNVLNNQHHRTDQSQRKTNKKWLLTTTESYFKTNKANKSNVKFTSWTDSSAGETLLNILTKIHDASQRRIFSLFIIRIVNTEIPCGCPNQINFQLK